MILVQARKPFRLQIEGEHRKVNVQKSSVYTVQESLGTKSPIALFNGDLSRSIACLRPMAARQE